MAKNTSDRPKPQGRGKKGLLQRLQAGLYKLPAHVTSEDDWQKDAPNIKLSRAFAIVLGIHVVAIGGFMAYEMFRHKEPQSAQSGASGAASRESRGSSVPAATPSSTRRVETLLDDPANAGLATHVVAPGESVQAIAERYGVEVQSLMDKNGLNGQRPFETGMKLVIPSRPMVASETPSQGMAPVTSPLAPATGAGVPENPLAFGQNEPPFKPAPRNAATTEPTTQGKRTERTPVPPGNLANATKKTSTPPSAPVKKAEPVTKKPQAEVAKAKGRRSHVVANGETLYRIAGKYGVSVDAIVRTNGVKPEKLKPGTTLIIPTSGR